MTDISRLLPGPVVRVTDEDGRRCSDHDLAAGWSSDELVDLYRWMALARGLDEQAVNLQRQGELALHLSGRGQEAAQVGAAAALQPQDWVFPQGRELAAAITRGIDPADVLQAWRGTWFCMHDPARTRFAPYTMPIATQLLHAVGVAMGAALAGDPVAVLACVGDGGTSEGDAHEAMNFAAVYGAPCVFFVQNNGWAISVPVRAQTRAPSLAHRGVGYGMPGVLVDGNDVLACHAVVAEALERARSGGGPTIVEALTYRIAGHSTSDDPTRYQPADEIEAWRRRDPLERMRRFLQREGLWTDDLGQTIDAEVAAARTRLRDAITATAPLDPLELFAHVYADPPASLLAQRDAFARSRRR